MVEVELGVEPGTVQEEIEWMEMDAEQMKGASEQAGRAVDPE